MKVLATVWQFLASHKTKIFGTIGFIATTILQQKAQQPDFLSATATTYLTIVAQLATGATVAGGVYNTVAEKTIAKQEIAAVTRPPEKP